MGYVFISYSSKDQDMANSIRKLFIENNVDCWMAPYDIPAGTKYAYVINDAIKDCACLCLVLSDAAQNSVFVDKEVERALSNGKTVIPIMIEDVVLNSGFEFYLSNQQIVAVHTLDKNSPEVIRILSSVMALAGTSSKISSAGEESAPSSPMASQGDIDIEQGDSHVSKLACPQEELLKQQGKVKTQISNNGKEVQQDSAEVVAATSPKVQELALIREKIAPARWRITGGRYQTLAILPSGKIWTKGGQSTGWDHKWNTPEWDSWRDVKSIINIFERVIGITSHGSVVLTDKNYAGKEVAKWENISMIACSRREYAGLRYDGTVVSTDSRAQKRMAQCQGIIEIAFFDGKLFGLCSDGTITETGYKDEDRNLTRDWRDIVSIASYPTHDGRLVGVHSDGTVIAVGDNDIGKCDFSAWKDIVAVACGPHHTLGLRADGTVVATGGNYRGECDVGEWKHIIAIACGSNHSVGLCNDGTLVAAGDNHYDQCDVIKVRLKKG